jgi:hypothetical protein
LGRTAGRIDADQNDYLEVLWFDETNIDGHSPDSSGHGADWNRQRRKQADSVPELDVGRSRNR